MLDLDELARLEGQMTKAPWGECGESGQWWVAQMTTEGEYLADQIVMDSGPDVIDQANLDGLIALRNAAPDLIATARTYTALLAAVGAVCEARGVGAEDDALLALAKLWEAQTGRSAKPHMEDDHVSAQ